MHKMFFAILALHAVLLVGIDEACAGGQYDIPEGLFHIDISTEDLNNIMSEFPEGGGTNPAYINSQTDPNIHILGEAEIIVTFIDEGAGYMNKFGYFTYDENNNILHKETLFDNASEKRGGGVLESGDSLVVGNFKEGDNVGFWLQADGFNDKEGLTYYTIDELNPDGKRHMAIMADEKNERLIIGIEDLYKLGDKDYNDIIFTFSANPFSNIDTSAIPTAAHTGAPAPPPVATAAISTLMYGLFLGRRWLQRNRRA